MNASADIRTLSGVMFASFRPRPGRIAMPDVCCDLIWVDERLWLAGPQSAARPSANIGKSVQLVNIDPLVARAWLGIPLCELTDLKIPFADIAASQTGRLSELFDRGAAARLVRPRTAHGPATDRRAAAVAAALGNGLSVGEAARAVGLSGRQMERHCLDWFGLSPKRYARVLRLRRAVKRANRGESLAEAALNAGYADQSHFNRDIRAMAGTTPRELLPHVANVQDAPVSLREY